MRRLTMKEVREQHGGMIPPDAILRPDADEEPPRAAPVKPKRRASRSERFATLNTFADFALAALTGGETKVWLILFRDTKGTGTARTGQADIARRAGLSARGVRKALDKLQAKGLVKIVHRGRLNAGPSVYRIHPTGAA